MLGLKLFFHAVRMVINNLGAMLQIFALPLLVVLAVLMAFSAYIGLGPFFVFSGQSVRFNNMSGGFMVVFFGTILVIWVALMNGVVHWHRFILLSETPNALMLRLSWRQAAKYIIGGILIVLLLILPIWLISMVAGRIAVSFAVQGDLWVARGIMVVVNLGFMIFFLALSPILPAAAIDQKFKLGDALAAMSGTLGTLLVCAVSLSVTQWGAALATQTLASWSVQLAVIGNVLVGGLTGMIGVSLITTLYGHFVEERSLA